MSRMLHTTIYCSALTRLAEDRRGVTAIVTAIALTVLLGFAGLAIDVAYWLNATRGMQAAADQAAYSAASAAGTDSCTSTKAVPQAIAIVAARGYPVRGTPTTSGGITTVSDGTTGVVINCNSSASTFKVTVSQVQPMWFTRLFMSTAPTGAANATAMLASQVSDLCILALDGTNVSAATVGNDADSAEFTGNTNLNVKCGIAVDSNSNQALGVGGSATVVATDIYLAGDDQGSPSGHGSLTTSPTANNILRHQPPVADPYLGSTIPTLSSCNFGGAGTGFATYSPSPGTLSPGVYCGGLNFANGSYTLSSGTYYIVGGGDFSIGRHTIITGDSAGVTLVLTGGTVAGHNYGAVAQLRIDAGASVSLTAPTSGPFGGLAIFQDRNATFSSGTSCGNGNAQNKINGGSSQLITGAIYFPNQMMCFNGNSSLSGPGQCTQIIARTLDFTGDSSVNFSCAGTGITPISVLVPQLIR